MRVEIIKFGNNGVNELFICHYGWIRENRLYIHLDFNNTVKAFNYLYNFEKGVCRVNDEKIYAFEKTIIIDDENRVLFFESYNDEKQKEINELFDYNISKIKEHNKYVEQAILWKDIADRYKDSPSLDVHSEHYDILGE